MRFAIAYNVNIILIKFPLLLLLIKYTSKFTQCRSTLLKALRSSTNDSIKYLWTITSTHANLQYGTYNSTKEVIKQFQTSQEDKLGNHLTSQGSFFSSVTKFLKLQVNTI